MISEADRILLGLDLKAVADNLTRQHPGDEEAAAVARGILYAANLVMGQAHNPVSEHCPCPCEKPAP